MILFISSSIILQVIHEILKLFHLSILNRWLFLVLGLVLVELLLLPVRLALLVELVLELLLILQVGYLLLLDSFVWYCP